MLAASKYVRLPPSVHTAKVTWVSDLAYNCPTDAFVLERPVLARRPSRVKPAGCTESMTQQYSHYSSPGAPPMPQTLRHVVALSAVPVPKLPVTLGAPKKTAQPARKPTHSSPPHPAQSVQYVQAFHDLVMHNIHYDPLREGTPIGMTTVEVSIDDHNGMVRGTQIRRSSGNTNWDMAVVQAIQSLGPLPKDNGRWDTSVIVTAAPKIH